MTTPGGHHAQSRGIGLELAKEVCLCFLGEEIDRYAQEVGADCVGEFVSATKTYPVYVMNYKGEEICLARRLLVLPQQPSLWIG